MGSMNVDDRIALLLGRAVMRAEWLAVQLEQTVAKLELLEQPPSEDVVTPLLRPLEGTER
jgi:hypothetical protein